MNRPKDDTDQKHVPSRYSSPEKAGRASGERVDEGRDQPRPGRVPEIDGRGASIDEGELRQRL